MNLEEALSAAIEGERVTSDSCAHDTYVSYDFNGFERKFMKRFGEWASCAFIPQDRDREATWRIETRPICGQCHGFKKSTGWGTAMTCGCTPKAVATVAFIPLSEEVVGTTRAANPIRDAWLKPDVGNAWLKPSEPKKDSWGRPIDS